MAFVIPSVVCLMYVGSPRKFALAYAVILFGFPILNPKRDVEVCYRGFFGVNQVSVVGDHEYHVLINGQTCHGIQKMSEADQPQPLSYYHREGPVGDVFKLHGNQQSRVAVVGLGIGSIAAYGQEGQQFDFYEIDPVVCQLANDEKYFSYLSTCRSEVNVILGDARVRLAATRPAKVPMTKVAYSSTAKESTNQKYGVIVLDAFGSDSVPIHLLTVEAIQLYLDCLEDDGLLAVHVSSKFLDLVPVNVASMERLGLYGAIRKDRPTVEDTKNTGRTRSNYLVMARNKDLVQRFIETGTGWGTLSSDRKVLWTDEHANILDIMLWNGN